VDDWLAANRRRWDERVAGHVESAYYDVAGFKAGRPVLLPFEVEELGPLDGLQLLHLQCHVGLDTLDIARLHPTVQVTGFDFSGPALEAATRLAAEVRLSERAHFVVGDVYRAPEALVGARYDVVYTGKGSLLWLPDLDRWAAVVRDLLAPGGFLYLAEFHPVAAVLGDDEPIPVRNYFATEPARYDAPGSYAIPDTVTVHNLSYEWQHPLSRVLTALLELGFRIELFHEWDFTPDPRPKWLVSGPDGRRWRPGGGSLPLLYSLKALRPA
jgi:SAM-dependent methyltransferase